METKTDKVAKIVTDRIVTALEEIIKSGNGSIPWKKPWKVTHFADGTKCYGAMNGVTCKPYRGINQVILGWFPGYDDRLWYVSLKQVLNMGFRIKKEEYKKSIPILFWGFKKVEDEKTGKEKKIMFKRFYTVYHFSQIDAEEKDILARLPIAKKIKKAKASDTKKKFNSIEAAENIVNNMQKKPPITFDGGDRAYYRPATDSVHMPMKENFESSAHFYATLFHELGHSTGHENRLNRSGIVEHNGFGTHAYSKEELVAEITSNMLMAEIELDTPEINTNVIAYCKNWLEVLKNDTNFILTASAQAQKAADFILGIQYGE